MYLRNIIPALALGLLLTACGSSADSSSKPGRTSAETTKTAAQTLPESTPESTPESSSQQEKSPLEDKGLTKAMFDSAAPDVNTVITGTTVMQDADISGRPYTLTLDLKGWAGKTSPEQIVTLSRLYWQCYPAMYERFGVSAGASRDVTFVVDINYDYEIADTERDVVYLHDNWLHDNPDDFDCMTHELAHVIQNVWDEEYLEYSSYTERFADYCRYVYALDNGYYNDSCWRLQDYFAEGSRESSVRFLVWLDYTYSKADTDLMRRFFDVCCGKNFPADDWQNAWAEVFRGTELDGMSIDDVWVLYAKSDFALFDSTAAAPGEKSQLTLNYDIRAKLKAHT